MNAVERKEFLDKKYLGKKATIISDFQGLHGGQIGKEGTIVETNDDRGNSTLKFKYSTGSTYWFFPLEIQVEESEPIIHKEKIGLQLKKKSIEEVDEFGNDYILHLLPTKEQEYIYLSSSLRTLLDVKNGDFINFALDKDNKLYYICKETDANNGYELIDGKIQSNVEWRSIFNTFNNETTKIEAGKVKLHISHYEREQEECPDYHLFLINEPWVVIEGNISKKKSKEIRFEEAPNNLIKVGDIENEFKAYTEELNNIAYKHHNYSSQISKGLYDSMTKSPFVDAKKQAPKKASGKQILQKLEVIPPMDVYDDFGEDVEVPRVGL